VGRTRIRSGGVKLVAKVKQSICLDCANYCNCSWILRHRPRKKWIAEPTVIKTHAGNGKNSYLVIGCSGFKVDAKRPHEKLIELSQTRKIALGIGVPKGEHKKYISNQD
jgi:hypothetical protein